MRLWSKMVDEGLHDGVTESQLFSTFRERMKNMPPEVREKRFRNVGDPRRTDRFKSTYELALNLPLLRMASPLTNVRSRCWKIRSAKLAVLDSRIKSIVGRHKPDAICGRLTFWTFDLYSAIAGLWWRTVSHANGRDFKFGSVIDSENEISEMRLHRPKIANEVAETILTVRHNMAAATN